MAEILNEQEITDDILNITPSTAFSTPLILNLPKHRNDLSNFPSNGVDEIESFNLQTINDNKYLE